MATIYIDGRPVEVDPHRNLLEVCLEQGLNLPYFCWHPAMGSVGACRQCAVVQYKDEHDTQGRVVMSCMTPAADGGRFSLENPEAKEMRREVIEWLMTSHPHDCPVCEEGGECHLQDMTVMSGHNYRRYRETKRTHVNQYLGPFINHEMNRCIACYRCVRFYQDYAGGKDLSVFASRNNVYFGRAEDGVLESEFSGNLVEVCPTGVFTDKTLSDNYARKWDLQAAPSVCAHCGLGCNTNPGERYGELRRVINRYHGEINGYFICDRGRFGYQFVNRDDRPVMPLLRDDRAREARTVYRDEALAALAPLLAPGRRIVGIGSPRASLESNYALKVLAGAENFSTGIAAGEQALLQRILEIQQRGPAQIPTLRETEQADAVLVLGEDVSNSAPRLALALRQALRQQSFEAADRLKIPRWQDAAVRTLAQDSRSPLYVLSPAATRLDEVAQRSQRGTPEAIARLGFAVAHALDAAAPAPADLTADEAALAAEIAAVLGTARRPLIVSGAGCGSVAVIEAAANIARALSGAERKAGLCYVVPEANSLGVTLLGGLDVDAALARVGESDTLVVLENDLYRRADTALVDAALARAQRVVVLDYLNTLTLARADIALPAGSFAEADGTLVNNEGRAQRYFQVYAPDPAGPMAEVQESWRWLRDAARQAGSAEPAEWKNLEAVTRACAAAVPALARMVEAAPNAAFRVAGRRLARQSPRASGRTALRAHISVHEPRAAQDPDSPLSFSMDAGDGTRWAQQGHSAADAPPPSPSPASGGGQGRGQAANVVPLVWMPGWNSNQAITKFQEEVGGHLRGGDPGVRLIEPAGGGAYFVPPAAVPTGTGLRLLQLQEIFGSDELSARAPAVAERMPAAQLRLPAAEAARHGITDGQHVVMRWNGSQVTLPVRFDDSLPAGTAAVAQGLPGVPFIGEAWVRIERGGAA